MVLLAVIDPSYGEPWSEKHRKRLRELALDEATRIHRTRPDRAPTAVGAGVGRDILVVLDRMLDDDDRWRSAHDARVVSSELKFGMEGKDPVRVSLSDGEVLMRGSADKVDRGRDGTLLITDIKSGKADSFKVIEKDPVAAGTKLQLPVYAHAALRAAEESGEPVSSVEAMYWFVRRDAGKRIPVTLDDELQKQYAATLETLVSSIRGGLFPGRPSKTEPYDYVECQVCTPNGVGHKSARERYERKRCDPALTSLTALIDPDANPADTEDGAQ